MNRSSKQRIVGSLVLLALGLVFLPLLFDGDGSYSPAISSRIPDPPVISVMPEPQASRPVIISETDDVRVPGLSDPLIEDTISSPEPEDDSSLDSNDSVADAAQATSDDAADESQTDSVTQAIDNAVALAQNSQSEATSPSLDADGLPVGWSVRLGSFSNSNNANSLLQRLLDADYRAYSRELEGNQGSLTAIFVGPQIERSEADSLKDELQDEFQLQGMVVKFEVDSL